MRAGRGGLIPPRECAPDLPSILKDRAGVSARQELEGVHLALVAGDADAAHSRISESRVRVASISRLDMTGTTLVDVAFDEMSAIEVRARDSRWRNAMVAGGRIGTLDAMRVEWDGVTFRGLRIDYLSLASANITDVRFLDCTIGTLDLPEATLTRVRFERSRADEVETRGLRCTHLDLRGLEALSFTDVRSLAGATIDQRQAEQHAATFAQAWGIDVRD